MNDLLNKLDLERNNIVKTYRDLHILAEPSWEEKKTAAYLKERLAKVNNISVTSFKTHHGFIAEIKGKSADVIALRTDLDALLQEVDGVVQPNHSCGHDAHATMVLYSAIILGQVKEQFNHTIRFIFQPAEEKAGGALQMMKDGALDRVRFLGGIHLRPAFEVPMGMASPVIIHSSTATITGIIKGVQAHAARPELGNNPIEAAAFLIQEMKKINLIENDSIKMTELHAGEASNIIPESARFTFDLRAKTNERMDQLIHNAKEILTKVAKQTNTAIDTKILERLPAAITNEHAIMLAEKAITHVLGAENVKSTCISPGGEDFHFYTYHHPAIAATMIGLGCDLKPGLHHPKMSFNTDALLNGTKILTDMIIQADLKQW
ncbi:amidohydrolase [Metabacillus fastidiosus]|uniref:amidohydrolase n=1 Tax=Metabacillus fastidiosus TaxID=1458 RepID=UPI002DB57B35|nr:amidohydrolase [Metabacillus fastidiosus]MEC2077964.1 amidohydrolase [Metabacillus fastidiosus]